MMDDEAARVVRALEDASKTADRLARRMGAEFVPNPTAAQSFKRGAEFTTEQLPLQSIHALR